MRINRQKRLGQVSPFPASPPVGSLIPNPGTFHVAAYTTTLGAGAVTDTDVPALTDQILLIQNGHFLPQADASIIWAAAMGATMTRAKFSSPKILQTNTEYIRPFTGAASPPTNANLMILPPGRLVIRGLEELKVLASDSAGADQLTIAFALLNNYIPPPQGDIFNFRFTGATTLTAHAWTQVPITFEQTPPVGTYAVIGCELASATGQAFRLTFDGMYYRPGLPCIPGVTARLPYEMTYGQQGVWGYFRTTNLPRLEVLANAADTSEEGYLQCVRVG